jgi:hypothetical protein
MTKRHYRVLCPSQRVTLTSHLEKRRLRRTSLLPDLDLYTNRMAFNRNIIFTGPERRNRLNATEVGWILGLLANGTRWNGRFIGRGPVIGPICPLPRTLGGATAMSVQWIETYEGADGAKTAGSLLATGDEVANLLYVCFERVSHKEWGCAP